MYIRRWADDNERVHVVDLAAGKDYLASIADVPVLNEFYTLESEDGTKSDAFELVLAGVEGKSASVFDAIEAGEWPLDDEHRGVMANFVALQMARLPSMRNVMDESMTQINQMMAQMTLASPEAFEKTLEAVSGQSATEADRAALRGALGEESWETMLTGAGFMDMMLEGIDEVLQPIYDMRWTLVTAERGEFITSDQPVFHWRHPTWPENRPWGLFTSERTHLPINRHQIMTMKFEFDDQNKLVTRRPDDEQTMLAPGVHIVNANAALASDRRFFVHPSALDDPDFTFPRTLEE